MAQQVNSCETVAVLARRDTGQKEKQKKSEFCMHCSSRQGFPSRHGKDESVVGVTDSVKEDEHILEALDRIAKQFCMLEQGEKILGVVGRKGNEM